MQVAGKQEGFTLLEMLLSVVIITLLVSMSLPLLQSFNNRNDIDVAAQGIAEMMRRAETYARAVNADSQWGVKIQSGSATLFSGSSYAGRNTNYDETLSIPTTVAISGALSEVVFDKLDAAPNTTGSVTLTSTNNDTRTVTINGEGMVDY